MIRAKLSRIIATVLSTFMIAGVVAPVSNAQQDFEIDPNALSYAYGGLLDLRLLENLLRDASAIQVATLDGTEQSWIKGTSEMPQGRKEQALNLSVLNSLIKLDLGTIDLPLIGDNGLLQFVLDDAELGLITEIAHAKNPNEAYAGVGLVTGDPATVDFTQGGDDDPYARINLISLLNLYSNPEFSERVIKEASLNLGVLGARAERPDTPAGDAAAVCDELNNLNNVAYDELNNQALNSDSYFILSESLDKSKGGTNEDNLKFCSGYRIADAELIINSPLIKELVALIIGLIEKLSNDLTLALGEDNALNSLIDSVADVLQPILDLLFVLHPGKTPKAEDLIDLQVTADIPLGEIIDELLEPLIDDADNPLVKIDLKEGLITVDLKQLHSGNLSNLDPNTPLISEGQLNGILDTVTQLLVEPAEGNPNGLMARLENILKGSKSEDGVHQGGLYDTEVTIGLTVLSTEIEVTPAIPPLVPAVVIPVTGGDLEIKSTLGGLLNDASESTTDPNKYEAEPYKFFYYETDGALMDLLGVALEGLVVNLAREVGGLVDSLIFDTNGFLDVLLAGVGPEIPLIQEITSSLEPALRDILQPLANVIVNRQTVEQLDQGNLFTVSALEINVIPTSTDPSGTTEQSSLVRIPISTAAVMAQSWNLIDLDINVAKIGDGRKLHNSGYTYDLVCEAPRWTGIEATGDDALSYDANNVGRSFKFNSGDLSLDGATGGLTTKVKVLPGSTCTVTASPGLASNKYLRPTGDTLLGRTPYTYFLDSDGTNALVSDELGPDDITETTTSGVTIDTNNDVLVDASAVGDKWKNHSFTFVIPGKATSHMVNVVHAYDIDQRDVVVKKVVEAAYPEDLGPFNFQYSVNDGPWTSPTSSISNGGSFPIDNIPLIDPDELDNSGTAVETQIRVREEFASLGDDAPRTITWAFPGPDGALAATDDNTYSTTAQFSVARGITAASTTTPALELTATNGYPVDIDFEAMLPATGRTTLVWVIGLGLLAALGALILYVRSRKQ